MTHPVLLVRLSCRDALAVAVAVVHKASADGLRTEAHLFDTATGTAVECSSGGAACFRGAALPLPSTRVVIVVCWEPNITWIECVATRSMLCDACRPFIHECLPCGSSSVVLDWLSESMRHHCLALGRFDSMDELECIPLHSARQEVDSVEGSKSVWDRITGELARQGGFNSAELQCRVGENPTMYLSWLQHYQFWLCFPAAAGSTLYMVTSNSGRNGDAVDSPWMAAYSIAIIFWGAAWLISWERAELRVLQQFSVRDRTQDGKRRLACRPRPARRLRSRWSHRGEAAVNPFTGNMECIPDADGRIFRQCFSFAVSVAMLSVVGFAQVCSLNLQGYLRGQDSVLEIGWVSEYSDQGEIFDPESWLCLVPITVCAAFIVSWNMVYGAVAAELTAFEDYGNEADHERALILKRVCFEFLDCFGNLFYVAFYRRDLRQLERELLSLYAVDQARRLLCELILPACHHQLQQWCMISRAKTLSREDEDSLSKTSDDDARQWRRVIRDQWTRAVYDTFDDYMEMCMQFGYVIFFASAFPLAGLLSFVSNVLERSSDLVKLQWVVRRPDPARSDGIGAWTVVMRAFVYIAVMTNVLIFAYSSKQMRHMFPSYFEVATGDAVDGSEEYVMTSVFVVEHAMLTAVLLLDLWTPRASREFTQWREHRSMHSM